MFDGQPQSHRAGNPQFVQDRFAGTAWQRRVFFNHLGVVEATHKDANRDAEGDAIEAGAQEIEPLEAEAIPAGEKGARFLTEIKDLDHVSKALKAAGWNIIASEIRYVAKNSTEVSDAHRQEVMDFLQALDDHDDVHHVYAALK